MYQAGVLYIPTLAQLQAVPAHQAQVYKDDGRQSGEHEVRRTSGKQGLRSRVLGKCSRVFTHLFHLFVKAVSFDLAFLIITACYRIWAQFQG